jgi:hypothetical protein
VNVSPLGGNSAACIKPLDHKFVLPNANALRNLLFLKDEAVREREGKASEVELSVVDLTFASVFAAGSASECQIQNHTGNQYLLASRRF